jgi:tRNA 2-thiouridine synthesizing protein A
MLRKRLGGDRVATNFAERSDPRFAMGSDLLNRSRELVRHPEMTQADKTMADATLDATGLLCPLPVLKARRALKPLAPGAVLEVIATDPGATKDFEHFCATTGCELLEASEQPGGILRFRMRKPG